MVQTYADVVAKQKEIGSAQILNPNYDVQIRQEQFKVDQANKILKEKATQKYIDEKLSEGFSLQSDGSLVKVSGYTTTTIIVNKDDGSVDIKTVTQSPPEKKKTSVYEQIESKIRKYERTLRDIDSGKTQASSYARNSIAKQLDYLYEARDNLRNTGSAFYTVPAESKTVSESKQVDSTVVFDSKGLGYSVAPELQKDFLAKKEASYKQEIVNIPQRSSSSFTVPRTISSQETVSVPFVVDTSKINAPVQSQSFGGTIQARKVGDYAMRFDSQTGERISPSSLDLAEMKVLNVIPESTLKPVASGVVAGLFSASKVGYTIVEASNFNPNELSQQATQSKIKQSALEIVKDPFGKLVNEPVMTVVNNPLYEAPKLATELVLLEGTSRVAKGVVKEVGATNKFLSSDLKASAYDLSRSSEKAQIFLKENQINPTASGGGSEFVPLPQLTVDVSTFNKNQKYFSNPEIDVPVERQFTLAGTEVKPPLNKKGILPLEEKTVSPFESNKITIEQIGKKPLIDATSTTQSRMIDLPVQKSFNKDTLQGTPILDLQNPERSSFISQDLKQTTLVPIENKVSSVPKGSNKPLIYERSKVVENKPVIDNSFAFESKGSVVVAESGSESGVISLPARSFGSEKKLVLSPDYVYDSGSDSFVRKVGDVELNLDIKGKVTPQDFRLKLAPVQVRSVIEQPRLIPEIKVDQIQSPAVQNDIKPKVDQSVSQGLFNDQNVDQGQKVRSKIVPIQSVDIVQSSQSVSESSLSLKLDQQPVQRVQPKLLSPKVEKVEIKPLFPKVNSERQVKSGFGLFDVLVRKEGKFVKVGSGYSDLATAFNRGRQEVKNTASASFKVVSRLGVAQKFNLGADNSLRYSKRDPNVIVQKREFRISSEGEKIEISRKGVFTQKLNKSLNKKTKGIFG